MTYKFELILVIQKTMAHKYKIIHILSSSNFICSVKYMIRFIYIGLLIFYTKFTHLAQKLKKKKK